MQRSYSQIFVYPLTECTLDVELENVEAMWERKIEKQLLHGVEEEATVNDYSL